MLSGSVCAQEIKTFDGSISLGENIIGKTVYQYYVTQRDTIKHKDYYFQSTTPDSASKEKLHGIRFSGAYNKGVKNGKWIYSYKELKPTGNSFINGYETAQNTNGKEYVVSADFNNGKAHGKWVTTRQEIAYSKPKDTSLLVTANFQEGKMTGVIEADSPDLSFRGSIGPKGIVNGNWLFVHTLNNTTKTKINEHRIYENGILKKHYLEVGGKSLVLSHFGFDTTEDAEGEMWEEVPLDSPYFKIIYYTSFGTESSGTMKISSDSARYYLNKTNEFLSTAVFSFSTHKSRDIWKLTSGSNPLEFPTFRVRKFPYSEAEKKQLAEANILLTKTNKIIRDFFDDPQVEISRFAYLDLAFYYQIMHVYRVNEKKLTEVIHLFSDPAFEYIDRGEIFEHMAPQLSYPDSVAFEFKDKKINRFFSFPQPIEKSNGNLSLVYEQLKKIYEDLDEIQRKVNPVLEKHKKQGKLSEKEEFAVKKKDSVVAFYNNTLYRKDFNPYHEKIASKIIDFTQHEFKKYAALPLEEKIERIDSLLACYDAVLYLYKKQAQLPRMLSRIDELYTRTVWNPFTFTDMDEIVKERVYNAYKNILFEHLLAEIEKSISCESIVNKANNFSVLYNKMLDLRDRDTQEIEKKLKRTTNVNTIIEVFEIEFHLN